MKVFFFYVQVPIFAEITCYYGMAHRPADLDIAYNSYRS